MKKISKIATLVGTLVLSVVFFNSASASTNPFSQQATSVQTTIGDEAKCGDAKGKKDGKCGEKAKKEGKCGEGKCGDSKKAKKEGKCGEGKCGDTKKGKKDGKCGKGKCGDKEDKKDSKCGEGKCGGK